MRVCFDIDLILSVTPYRVAYCINTCTSFMTFGRVVAINLPPMELCLLVNSDVLLQVKVGL